MGELKERVSGLLPAEACCLPQRSLFQLPHPSRFESITKGSLIPDSVCP
jgi:hypothetical protein